MVSHKIRKRTDGYRILATSYFRDRTLASASYEGGSLSVSNTATFALIACRDAIVAVPLNDPHVDYSSVTRELKEGVLWRRIVGTLAEGVGIGMIVDSQITRYGDGLELTLGDAIYPVYGLSPDTTARFDIVELVDERLLIITAADGRDTNELPEVQALRSAGLLVE